MPLSLIKRKKMVLQKEVSNLPSRGPPKKEKVHSRGENGGEEGGVRFLGVGHPNTKQKGKKEGKNREMRKVGL